MSETLKLSPEEAKKWLEKETESVFVPVHAKAKKLLKEMEKTLEKVEDACNMLLESSRREIERRNMKVYKRARGLNKLARLFLERFRRIKVPKGISYNELLSFIQDSQEVFLITETDIKNWFPRISPFFIFDRRKFLAEFEKAKEKLGELQSFLAKKYVKIKTLEETFFLIETLQKLKKELSDMEIQKKQITDEKAAIENRINEIQQKITRLEAHETLTLLNTINMEIEKLRLEAKHVLRHLRKPFMKLQSFALRQGGLTPEELKKLDQYMENPFEALATEEKGFPILRQILQKLATAMAKSELKLKQDKKRKAEQAIHSILDKNLLDDLQQKCKKAITLKKQLSTSPETRDIRRNIAELQEKLEKLKHENRRILSERAKIEAKNEEMLKRIRDAKYKIEKNVFELVGRKILIE